MKKILNKQKNMAARTKYSVMDMVQMAKLARDEPNLKGLELIKFYNELYPEKTEDEKKRTLKEFCKNIAQYGMYTLEVPAKQNQYPKLGEL